MQLARARVRKTRRNSHLLEDASQSALLTAHLRWHTYCPKRGSIQSWLRTIAHRAFLKELKAEQRHQERMDHTIESAEQASAESEISRAPCLAFVVAEEEEGELMQVTLEDARALVRLWMDTDVQAYRMRRYDCDSYQEIAEALNVTVGTARGKVTRGEKKLVAALSATLSRYSGINCGVSLAEADEPCPLSRVPRKGGEEEGSVTVPARSRVIEFVLSSTTEAVLAFKAFHYEGAATEKLATRFGFTRAADVDRLVSSGEDEIVKRFKRRRLAV